MVPALGRDDLPQVEDLVAVEGFVAEDHFEAVELGRIVAAGDLESAVGLQRGDGEVERGRGKRAHVHCGPTGVDDALPDAAGELRTGRPVIASDRDGRRASQPLPGHTGERLADGAGQLGRELPPHDPADVVLPEDRLGNVH